MKTATVHLQILLLVAVMATLPKSRGFQTSMRPTTRILQAVNGDKKSSSSLSDESTAYNFIGLNTNKNAPYVPSGLSPDQYNQIKQEEAARLSKMDFGAWGPRFKRTQAPDGDWMVQTSLWVRGFQYNGNNQQPPTEQERARQTKQTRQLTAAKVAMSSFLLAYLVLNVVLSTSSTRKIVSSVLARQGILEAARPIMLPTVVLSKLQIFKMFVAGISVPAVNQYREIANRRWLWSKRRIFGTPIVASFLFSVMVVVTTMGLAALR